jgi:hypothetical protein
MLQLTTPPILISLKRLRGIDPVSLLFNNVSYTYVTFFPSKQRDLPKQLSDMKWIPNPSPNFFR